jgi:trigger factor
VRLGLLVQELISSSKIEIDRDRVDARISELSSPYEDSDQAAQLYRSNRQLMSQVETSVLEEQVVDFLVEKAKVREKAQKFEDFMQTENT